MITPLITGVNSHKQENGITTIFFEYTLVDGHGPRQETFELNNYELHHFYNYTLGWDKAYSPFTQFWSSATDQDKTAFLYLLITIDKSIVSASVKAKIVKSVSCGKVVKALIPIPKAS